MMLYFLMTDLMSSRPLLSRSGCILIGVMDIKYYPILKKATAGTFRGTLDELKAVIEKQDDPVTVKRYQIAFKAIEDLLETL